jgi:predicted lipoprotein with Yx(FWY)xxD motif
MRSTDRRTGAPTRATRTRRAAIGLAALGSLSGLALGLSAPSASAQAVATAGGSAVVVHISVRGSFGRVLAKESNNRTLYEDPGSTCTGGCLSVWPALLMPKGDTVPTGVKGLGTASFAGGRLQVTYHGQRLYTFVNDSGKSVNGNGVGGFVVAKYTA